MHDVILLPDFLDHRRGHLVRPHVHAEGQVLVATEGQLEVQLGGRRVVVDRGTALWAPPGALHASRALEATAFRGVMVGRPNASLLPAGGSTFPATALLLAAVAELKAPRPRRRALASSLLLDELLVRLAVPRPATFAPTERFAAVCARALDDPAGAPCLDEAARQAGASRRSFSRAFRAATGRGWSAWVREVRLARAAALLADGASALEAALEVGYTTASAFSVAFRRQTGRCPKELRRARGG